MGAFNNEIASADRIGLHLSEIGRLQNNAGALLQVMALIVVLCIYFFNNIIYPSAGLHRMIYGAVFALDCFLIVISFALYLRCLTLSVGWVSQAVNPKTGFHLLSTLSEEQIEHTLYGVIRSFRRGTYCFALTFVTTIILVFLTVLGELKAIPTNAS